MLTIFKRPLLTIKSFDTCSNIPTAPTYRVYTIFRTWTSCLSFLYKELLSMSKLLVHGVLVQIDC